MRWDLGRRSDNIEDRRGQGLSRRIKGGGIGVLLLALVGMYFGIDPALILNLLGGGDIQLSETATQRQTTQDPAQDRLADFISVVLADTEDTWKEQFQRMGATYQEPKLVLFSNVVQSACGFAQAATGPFYCPGDGKVYIDLGFYDELKHKLHAPGDFAQAYVVAHEIGHHVQNLLGISDKVHTARQRVSQAEYNQLSVRLELQADCFAGIWAHHADRSRGVVEPGDIEEALNAASQIGDDRLQRANRGYVTPDSFTHGSSAQRMRWFRRGFTSGRIQDCNTFGTDEL
ncbi:MAG: flagellar biosynthesis protein FlgM [Desulfobulbaceae bacterium A2]|nr:MAG: flagellar biosynthesis protein FlgM [Desulfobulbaceae bacterium A2]